MAAQLGEAYLDDVKVIVCDDEPDIRLLYRTAFQRAGTDVVIARDGDECVTLVDQMRPGLVVLDLMMPRRNGFSALAELHSRWPGVHVVVVRFRAHANFLQLLLADLSGLAIFLASTGPSTPSSKRRSSRRAPLFCPLTKWRPSSKSLE